MYCPGGNSTDPIWRVLASSQGISCWTPLKPQHSNPNPLANKIVLTPLLLERCSHHPSQTSCLPWISYATKNWCSIHARWSKNSLKHSIRCFCGIIFSKFRRVYSNCCCSRSFEAEIIRIGQSSHKMYSNNIVKFQESTTILNACTKKSGNLLNAPRICACFQPCLKARDNPKTWKWYPPLLHLEKNKKLPNAKNKRCKICDIILEGKSYSK